jgi:plasmid stabilization system protein ParE
MIGITRSARRQIDDLLRFYIDESERPDAARRLLSDLAGARKLIVKDSRQGLSYPRPYPALAKYGFRWARVRAYWIAWTLIDERPVITNVFHVSADIERRATPATDGIEDW